MKNMSSFQLILAMLWLGVAAGCTGIMPQQSDAVAEAQAEAIIDSYQNLHGISTVSVIPAIPTIIPTPTLIPSPTPTPVILQSNAAIAFVSTYYGNSEIFIINVNGSEPTRLTNNEADDYLPAWSPDGKYIAFISSSDIYRMNADGSNQTRLTDNASDSPPTWSPDGKYIAFVSGRDGNNEIYRMNVDGSNQTRLTNTESDDFYPAWSPDGEYIAFVSKRIDEGRKIYIMNADGSNQRLLTNIEVADRAHHPHAWSPDSKKVMFESASGDVDVVNADGSGETLFLDQISYLPYSPAWSPDGKQVAFGCNGGNLCTIMTDGSGLMTYDNIFLDGVPSWSPDSKYIVFKANDRSISMLNVVSLEQVRLTDISRNNFYPVWSPVCTACP
jgi:Tol biopolymer transport system component